MGVVSAVEERRFRMAAVSSTDGLSILAILRGDMRVTNLPADAVIHRIAYEIERDEILMILASASFERVPRESPIPGMPLVCYREAQGEGVVLP